LSNKNKSRVVIIGAGPAGLTAGFELLKLKEDYAVVVLEETNAIGGISKTVKYKGNRMDIGGHRFFSKDKAVMDWWLDLMPIQGELSFDDKELGRDKNLVQGGPDPEKHDNVFLIRNRVSRIYYLKKFFDYPVSINFDTFKNLGIWRTIKSGFSYLQSSFMKRKEITLEDFFINRFGKVLYSMFFEGYTEKLWGRHPSDISSEWGAQRVKGLSIFIVIKEFFKKALKVKSKKIETSLIEEFIYPKYGPGQLWELVAEKIKEKNGKVLLNHKVIEFNLKNNKINSVVTLNDDKKVKIEGDIFISTMPIKDLVNSLKIDNLPKNVLEIADGLPYRDFITIGLLIKNLNLKNKTNIRTLNNIVPDCWIYVQEPEVQLGRIQIFNNWSPYMVNKPKETIWIGLEYFCSEGDELWNMTNDEMVEFASNELISLNIIKKNDIVDAHCEKVIKAYPAYFDTYKEIDEVIEYLDSIDNLYCIGRNGQHRYNNMDHSMVTAFECVNNISKKIKDKTNIWQVNTEEEYHETKN
jgi:protoporphyrinogen oxidase